MSVRRRVDVFCDACGNWELVGVGISDVLARRHVKRGKGWVRRLVDGRMCDLCPACACPNDAPPVQVSLARGG